MRNFETSPLITPEIAIREPHRALAVPPSWVVQYGILDEFDEPEVGEGHISSTAVLVLGKRHRKTLLMSVLQASYLYELSRFGNTFGTNSNFGKPKAIIYPKFWPRDFADDRVTLARIFADASSDETVDSLEGTSDLRLFTLRKNNYGRPRKAALETVKKHTERVAKEREASGSLPSGITVDSYLANIAALYAAILEESASPDREAATPHPETWSLPQTDGEAIAFALDHLLTVEVPEFLKQWRNGEDLQWWIDTYAEDWAAPQA
ncbi:hypothetical protein [Oricola indica]|jgi:hypothetical protein|uniref:hypothetical protein n=1 Tax=Oricola indica TaxID=2872591 RepID=UPI001CBFC108|nr:hypothetical protein [Oricola indica]